MRMRILAIICSMAPLITQAQDHCMIFPAKKLDIITNPSFEAASGACGSGYLYPPQSISGWSSLHTKVPLAYLNACSNYNIPTKVFEQNVYTDLKIYIDANMDYRGFYGPTLPPAVPQPVPDGKGIIVITDAGIPHKDISPEEYIKNYLATCLQQPLQQDSLYRLDFYVGFGGKSDFVETWDTICEDRNVHPYVSSPCTLTFDKKCCGGESFITETVALFGKEDCTGFTMYPDDMNCPVARGWVQLGSCTLTGANEWVKASISFVAPKNINAIAIGPSCDKVKGTDTSYLYEYFIDALQLYKPSVARPYASVQGGSVCNRDVTLQMQPAGVYKSTDLQWFKNNVPIANATGETLQVTDASYGEGYYQSRVQNDTVCLFTDSLAVMWQALPAADVLGNGDTVLCNGDSVKLNAYSGNGVTYLWQDGSTAPAFTVKQAGVYKVAITNTCGTTQAVKNVQFIQCADSLFVPTAFTPNGDGVNDIFRPRYFYNLSHYSMQVFDRYGERIFVSRNISDGWNGYYRGIKQPPGVYIYTAQYKGTAGKLHQVKGTVTLIR